MDKLRMRTANKADENFKKLVEMFPNAVTETITGYDENGKAIVERAIDKDVLMQEISCEVVEGNEERYQFTWPDKKKSVLLANAPINKTSARLQKALHLLAKLYLQFYRVSGMINFICLGITQRNL